MKPEDILSIQLYSLREYGDLDRQLDALAGLGFKKVETIGGQLVDAAGTRAKLDSRGLTAPSSHVGMADLRSRPDWVVEQAKTMGVKQLYMPAVPPEERQGPAEYWRGVGAELGRLADQFAGQGLVLGYHNHHWELEAYADGSTPLQHLFEGAGSSPLRWEADIAWLVRGKADPAAWLERYRDRLVCAHVKDIAPEGQNQDEDGWADVGRGVLDWPKLWSLARANGAELMVLEHDKPKDPVAFARNSREFVLASIR